MQVFFFGFVPYDLLALIALSSGCIVRLCDEQVRTAKQSFRQLVFSFTVGAALTALFVALTTFVVLVQLAACFLLSLFASLIIEVAEHKLEDLRDAKLIDWVKVVIAFCLEELAKYLPSKKSPPAP